MEKWENGEAEAKKLVSTSDVGKMQLPPTTDSAVMQNGGHRVMNGNGNDHNNGALVLYNPDAFACAKSETTTDVTIYEDDEDIYCGLCSFTPAWLQPLANKKSFLGVFCLTSVLQGMYYTYFVSVLTTIEKIYQIPSKTTGIIMAATEIGQIGGSLILTYYGGQGHRPKWIACGMLIFAMASILCSTPHFFFGGRVVPRARFSAQDNVTTVTLKKLQGKVCSVTISMLGELSNETATMESITKRNSSAVNEEQDLPGSSEITPIVLILFFFSLLFIGIGATAVNTLGIPYIDDNVATKESPLYFGTTIGVRILGPVFGFLLGSFCTSVYVNFPFERSQVHPDDPQWAGAWWLGVDIVGIALILAAFPMMSFPRKLPQLPGKALNALMHTNGRANGVICAKHLKQAPLLGKQAQKKKKKNPSLKDFPAAVRRLLQNKILLLRTASNVLHILPIAGLYTFLPKFLESQFQLTATTANMITGIAGILVMGVGIFASGYFMRKFKPSPRIVALWIAICALTYSMGMVILMWFGCPINKFVGLNAGNGELEVNRTTCADLCRCKKGEFFPICTSDGITYMSPCLAGCTKVSTSRSDQYVYSDCQCLQPNVTATNGYCPLKCENLIWYIVIFSIFVLIHSTSEVGSMLLTLRCVDRKDKAMALGLLSFAIGLFGNVPCPIIYGAVVDSACLFWEDNDGDPGACRVYDPYQFRMLFHGLTAMIMMAAFVVDVVVYFKAPSIQFHEDEETAEPQQKSLAIDSAGPQFETSV